MRYLDVTQPITDGMPVYPGDPPVSVRPYLCIADGAPVNLGLVTLGTHTGTHLDAPRHFFDGAGGVDRIPLEALLGPARVVEVAGAGDVDAAAVRAALDGGERRLLFKTRNSARPPADRLLPGYAALTPEAARLLVEADPRPFLVGLDGPSVDGHDTQEAPAHRLLLRSGVAILEGLELSAVPPGAYELLCLPLALPGGDGAPARVLLRQTGEAA